MQQHECTYMCLDLIVDFILINFFLTISQCSHQIIKSISLFGKVKFLGCYRPTTRSYTVKYFQNLDRLLSNHLRNPLITVRTVTIST